MLYLARLLATEGAANGHVAKTPRARRRPTWLARTERTSVRTRSLRSPHDGWTADRQIAFIERDSLRSRSGARRQPRWNRVRARAALFARTRTRTHARAHARVAATFGYFQPDLPSRRERLRSNRELLSKREGGLASGPAQPNPTDVTNLLRDGTSPTVLGGRNVPLLFSSNKSDTKRFPPGGTRPLLIDA